jgi:hypothetical protein
MENAMTKLQEKSQAQVKQFVGQMVGDDRLVLEGKEQQRQAEDTMGKTDQGIVKDDKGQEQPKDKERAQTVHQTDTDQSASKEQPHDDPLKRKGPVLD